MKKWCVIGIGRLILGCGPWRTERLVSWSKEPPGKPQELLIASSRQNLEISCSLICRKHWNLEWNKEELGLTDIENKQWLPVGMEGKYRGGGVELANYRV